MKRMHVHVSVEDISKAAGFYSALFAAKPAVIETDYAKWMLDDPRVNFAISTHGREPGLDHLGIQVESTDELHEVYGRLRQAGGAILEQGQTTAATQGRRSPGSTTRLESRGRLSTPRANPPTTA
jgi:predicted enzyme related to lactoylglutathione lyase